MHLSVCDSNDDKFLGEVLVPLSNVDLRNVNENWYILQEKVSSLETFVYYKKKTLSKYSLTLSIMYDMTCKI